MSERRPAPPRMLAALAMLLVATMSTVGLSAALPAPARAQTCVDPQALPLGTTAYSFTLGNVVFEGAILPGGAPVDLVIQDNFDFGPNGFHEVGVPWSEAGAPRYASIQFPASSFGPVAVSK